MSLKRRSLARTIGFPFDRVVGHTIYVGAMRSEPVLVDVGANRGAFSRAFNDRFGGQAVLVEPNPSLSSQLGVTPPFRTLAYAVAPTDGPVTFNIAKNDEGSSLLQLPDESRYGCTLDHTETVEGRTVDSLVNEIGETRIDVLKLDVEGIELLVLPQLTEAAAARIAQVTVEFHCDPVFGFGRREKADDVHRRLRSLGFVDFDFSDGRIALEDVLFVNRRLYNVSAASWWFWRTLVRLRAAYRILRRTVRAQATAP